MEKLLNLEGLGKFKELADETYAVPDGYYEEMTVGDAEQLVATAVVEDSAPYNFRTAGGSVDIGNREYVDAIVGGTVVWNQLVDTTTGYVTIPSGHKYFANIEGTKTVGISTGSSIRINDGTEDNLHDLTQMFGSTIADYIYNLEQTTAGAGVAWFKKLFPKDYYEYNAGELMSVNVSEHNTVGFNAYDNATGTAQLVGGQQYQISGTYTSISYEDINGNAETLTPDSSGLFTPANSGILTVVGGNGTDTCVHLTWSGYRNGEYEEYEKHTYELDSSLELRGIPKLDANNNLYYDGDTYEADGTVTRRIVAMVLDGTETGWAASTSTETATRYFKLALGNINTIVGGSGLVYGGYVKKTTSFSSGTNVAGQYNFINSTSYNGAFLYIRPTAEYGDYTTMSVADFKVALAENPLYIVYELATPTTETAGEYNEVQIVDDFGTEEYVDYAYENGNRDVAIPVGHNTEYPVNLRDKLQHLPSLASEDGDYIIRQTGSQLELVESSEADILEDLQILNDFCGYSDDIIGLQIDFQTKTCRRLGAAVGLNKGTDFDAFTPFGGRRVCNVADDGTINAYYGDASYAEDGSNGQVMVYQPKFYYKVVPITLEKQSDGIGYHTRKANYYISGSPKQGFKLFPAFYDEDGNEVEYVLIGSYEGSIYDASESAYVTDDSATMDTSADKFSSVANVKPASGLSNTLTRPNIEALANNRGSGWHMQNPQFAMLDVWLQMIEYGTPNSQNGAGSNGIVSITDQSSYSCTGNTGSTASIGNGSGQAESTTFNINGTVTTETANGKTAYRYRGVENPWGNIWKFIHGLNIWGDGTLKGGVPFVCTDFEFAESKKTDNYVSAGFTVPNTNNYVTALGYGKEEFDWLLMASEVGASANSLVNDYNYVTANLNGYRVARLGGAWFYGSYAGSLTWILNDSVGYRSRAIGGRLVYVPTAKA